MGTQETIRLLAANAFAERVGDTGLRTAQIDALGAEGARVHADLTARRGAGGLPFYDLPFDRGGLAASLAAAHRARETGDTLLVLGIGGSALGTTAVQRALNPGTHNLLAAPLRAGMRLFVCDNVDPEGFGEVLDLLEPGRTVVNVISKSGGTAETLAQFLAVRRWLVDALGPAGARRRIVVTTDPTRGYLRRVAQAEGLAALDVPPGVGGRFSVFTPVGLFPLAAVGVDVEALLDGACSLDAVSSLPGLWDNPAYLFAAIHVAFLRQGRNVHVLMPYSDGLRDVADWFRQLWAESLGKRRALDGTEVCVGPTPVKALGTTDQHSQVQLYVEGPQDKVITFVEVENLRRDIDLRADVPGGAEVEYLEGKTLGALLRAEKRATEAALTRAGRPNLTIRLPRISAHAVGQLLHLLQIATVFAGGLLGIDPLDQPGVELGKELTFGLLGRPGYEARAREVELLSTPDPRLTVPHL
ncbi:MAG: glucose-6-phosphate isomerase [Deltaproteobacteria bacterium]|nr:glucose-6-phosphate isomerase [Deltaproteobacteria bacterium]